MNFCKIEPIHIFEKLLKFFGPQYWWPASSTYEIIIGALLAQSVNWKNVELAIDNLEKNNLLSPEKILSEDEKLIMKLIKPSRYPQIKIKRLKNLLKFFEKENFDLSNFEKMETLTLRKQLLSVNGVGKETADSILLYGFNKPIFVVDAYTKRVFERHGCIIKKKSNWYEEIRLFFENRLPKNVNIYNELHALLVALGNTYCKAKPLCEKCPLKEFL